MARILVADDEEDIREFLVDALALAGHAVEAARDGREALARLDAAAPDVVLMDLHMPPPSGLELLAEVRARRPDAAVVVLTAYGTVAVAVEAMKLGAVDFLEKPVESPGSLRLTVAHALERSPRARRVAAGDAGVTLTWGAPSMRAVEAALRRVAPTEATVLLLGESGTGKEVAARAVHQWSRRAAGPFAAINCATLSETLLESELFGHERGAFTGAAAQRRGRIEEAAGGTFFLDEVGELRPELQARLLRVLQEREFTRVGGNRALRADVRWVAATNRDLARDVADGRFREDLYHRLAVVPVRIPPLRERREDVPHLADALFARTRDALGRPDLRLDDDARRRLAAMDWPGNVRALANALERAAILEEGPVLRLEPEGPAPPAPAPPAAGTMEEVEIQAIRQALASQGGNRRRAAERLGIGLRTLYEKLKRYNLR